MPDALNEIKIADFRRRICETAIRQLAENGLENLSMRSLAKELGYSATALYSYFRNKEEILAAVHADTFNRLADTLEAAHIGSPEPWAKFKSTADAYGQFAANHPTAYGLAFANGQPPAAQYPELAQAETRLRTVLQQMTTNLVDASALSCDPNMLTQMIWAALHGTIALALAQKLQPTGAPPAMLWQETLALIIRGASGVSGKKVNPKTTDRQFHLDL